MKKGKFFIYCNRMDRYQLGETIIAARLGKLGIASSLLGAGDLSGRG
jgi:hypothetical protein